MNIVKFTYTKKKNNEKKEYLIMKIDIKDSVDHIGGLDLSKLSDEDIESVLKIQSVLELKTGEILNIGLLNKEDFLDLVNGEEYVAIIEDYKEKIKPYIKKAFRLFIKERIEELEDVIKHNNFFSIIINAKSKLNTKWE